MNDRDDGFSLFVSYARKDNATHWIEGFLDELSAAHTRFFPDHTLTYFFDKSDIHTFSDWQARIGHSIAKSKLFLAFVSPNYFKSEWCRREWRAWQETEIALHILSSGAAPIFIVPIPGLDDKPSLTPEAVAARMAAELSLDAPHDAFVADAAGAMKSLRVRQAVPVVSFYEKGFDALKDAELRAILDKLAKDVSDRVQAVADAKESPTDIPPYNKRFSGRIDELRLLRERLKNDNAGVICGIHGLGGMGKSELAYTYAHAYASAYRGGRFNVPCDGQTDLKQAVLRLAYLFPDGISDDERKLPAEKFFLAVRRCLAEKLKRDGDILLVLDNVTDAKLVSPTQTNALTSIGPGLHLLATTRLPPATGAWLTLGALPESDALELLRKYRPFDNAAEENAALEIVRRLGGFTLAVELAGAFLLVHTGETYAGHSQTMGLDEIEFIGKEPTEKQLITHQEKLLSAVLTPLIKSLSPAERRAMEYAALLPPDTVALPWLKTLVERESFDFGYGPFIKDPWTELERRFFKLALITRPENENSELRLVKVHRLVQEFLQSPLAPEPRPDSAKLGAAVKTLIEERDADLRDTTNWVAGQWEIEPFVALAKFWDETGDADAAELLSRAGQRCYELADYAQAEQLMCRALALDELCFGKDDLKVANRLVNLAALLQDTNRLSEAEQLNCRALVILETRFGKNHPRVAIVLNNLATLLHSSNRLSSAEPLIRRALAIDEATLGINHPNVARDLNNLAALLNETNRMSDAEQHIRRALAINQASFGKDHPRVAGDLNNLAQLLQATNRLSEAESLMRRALDIDEACFGKDHPNVAIRLNNLGGLLQTTNQLSEAEPLFRRGIAIFEVSLGENHPNVASSLYNLAGLLYETNRLSEAEPLLRRALDIGLASFGQDHPNVARFLNNLAQLLRAANRLSEAEPLFRRGISIFEVSLGENHPNVASSLFNLAGLLCDTNRLNEAEPLMRKALAIFEASLGEEHPTTKGVANNLQILLNKLGA